MAADPDVHVQRQLAFLSFQHPIAGAEIVVEASVIRGGFLTLWRHSLFWAVAARIVLVEYREGLSI